LEAVTGVESVKTDVKESTATVTPKKDKAPSPKELWEAVVNAGYTPSLIEGPGGKFEKTPTK
jgi:copper chaperone CopZ